MKQNNTLHDVRGAFDAIVDALEEQIRKLADVRYDETDEARSEEREAYEVDKADAKRKGEW